MNNLLSTNSVFACEAGEEEWPQAARFTMNALFVTQSNTRPRFVGNRGGLVWDVGLEVVYRDERILMRSIWATRILARSERGIRYEWGSTATPEEGARRLLEQIDNRPVYRVRITRTAGMGDEWATNLCQACYQPLTTNAFCQDNPYTIVQKLRKLYGQACETCHHICHQEMP